MSRPRKSRPAQQQSLKVLTTDEQSSFTGLNLICKKARICGYFLHMRVCCLSRINLKNNLIFNNLIFRVSD